MSTQLASLQDFVAARGPAIRSDADDRVVVLASGKGGVGTSTLAALLAAVTSSTGANVLLVDGTADVGTLHLLLGVDAGIGWGALRGDTTPEEMLVRVDDTLTLFPGTSAEDYGAAGISAAERQTLFRRVAGLYPRYDLVVVDAGSRLDSVTAACAAGVGSVLSISTPDRVSVAATYALMKVLEGRYPGVPMRVLINRNDASAPDHVADALKAGVRRFLNRSIDQAGTVPEDQCLRAGIDAGMNVQDAAIGSHAAGVIYNVGMDLIRSVSAASVSDGDPLNLHRRT